MITSKHFCIGRKKLSVCSFHPRLFSRVSHCLYLYYRFRRAVAFRLSVRLGCSFGRICLGQIVLAANCLPVCPSLFLCPELVRRSFFYFSRLLSLFHYAGILYIPPRFSFKLLSTLNNKNPRQIKPRA